jgi:hypothetical protein
MTESDWLAATDPAALLNFLQAQTSGISPAKERLFASLGVPPDRARSRKLRLFGCACCRRIWHLLPDESSRHAVEVSERHADGEASAMEQLTAWGHVAKLSWSPEEGRELDIPEMMALLRSPRPELTAVLYAAWPTASFEQHVEETVRSIASVQGPSDLFRRLAGTVRRVIGGMQREAQRMAMGARHAASASRDPDEPRMQCELVRDIFGNPFATADFDSAWREWNGGTVRNLAQTIYEEQAFERLPILGDALEDASCTSTEVLAHCHGPGPHVRGCWVVDLLLAKR